MEAQRFPYDFDGIVAGARPGTVLDRPGADRPQGKVVERYVEVLSFLRKQRDLHNQATVIHVGNKVLASFFGCQQHRPHGHAILFGMGGILECRGTSHRCQQ